MPPFRIPCVVKGWPVDLQSNVTLPGKVGVKSRTRGRGDKPCASGFVASGLGILTESGRVRFRPSAVDSPSVGCSLTSVERTMLASAAACP